MKHLFTIGLIVLALGGFASGQDWDNRFVVVERTSSSVVTSQYYNHMLLQGYEARLLVHETHLNVYEFSRQGEKVVVSFLDNNQGTMVTFSQSK